MGREGGRKRVGGFLGRFSCVFGEIMEGCMDKCGLYQYILIKSRIRMTLTAKETKNLFLYFCDWPL